MVLKLKVEKEEKREESGYLHNLIHVPENRVGVEGSGGIKPQINPLFSVSLSSREHIGLQYVWLPSPVPQELKVYFVVL